MRRGFYLRWRLVTPGLPRRASAPATRPRCETNAPSTGSHRRSAGSTSYWRMSATVIQSCGCLRVTRGTRSSRSVRRRTTVQRLRGARSLAASSLGRERRGPDDGDERAHAVGQLDEAAVGLIDVEPAVLLADVASPRRTARRRRPRLRRGSGRSATPAVPVATSTVAKSSSGCSSAAARGTRARRGRRSARR